MTILVAGAGSFLGRALISELDAIQLSEMSILKRCEPVAKNCNHDQRNIHCVDMIGNSLLKKDTRYDTIFLLSTVYSRNLEKMEEMVKCNIQFLANIMKLSPSNGGHIIYTNSYMALPSILNFRSSLYAKSKDFFSKIAEEFSIHNNIAFDNMYLFDVIGPNDSRKKFLNLVAESYVKKITMQASKGDQLIAPISASDAARCLKSRVGQGKIGLSSNWLLHGDVFVTIRELVAIVENIYCISIPIEWGNSDSSVDQVFTKPCDFPNIAANLQNQSLEYIIRSVVDPILGALD
jgi:nucleoside-diphosphate-sugar epimerase